MKVKAIEPLIATILLVVVAVILVTIVLAWGRNFSNNALGSTSGISNENCDGATISISSCDFTAADGTVKLFITNTSTTHQFDVNAFVANIFSDENTDDFEMDQTVASDLIAPGAMVQGTIDFNEIDTDTNRVTVTVRSSACPTMATDTIRACQ